MRASESQWDELESAATKMFRVGVDGSELEWAREAWSHLTGGA